MQRFPFLICLLLVLILGAQNASSQLLQPYRFEQEIKFSEEGFTVISMKKEGLALVRDANKPEHNKKNWQLEFVDTVLSKIWSTELSMPEHLDLVGYEYNPGHLYLLYREAEHFHNTFQLVTILFKEKEIQHDEIKFEVDFKLTHFTMAGSSAIFGGHVTNQPAVLLYNRSSDHPKVLPGLFISSITLLDVRANQNESFNVLLADQTQKEKKKLVVRTYDHEGNLLVDDIIDIDPRLRIITGLTTSLERDELIIAGTYGQTQGRPAIGFFSVVVDPFNEQTVNYTDFAALPHFLDYLSEKLANKHKLKAQKKRASGRLPDFEAYVIPHRIEERENGFYLLAEVYHQNSSGNYPYNSNNSMMPYGMGYQPYAVGQSRYYNTPYSYYNYPSSNNGVQMVETMVMKLDNHARPEKDVSMKLQNIRLQGLEQIGDFAVVKDSILLIYKKESELLYQKELGEPDEETEIKELKIQLQDENDALRNENSHEGVARYWYEGQFYVWGYQTIRDNTREGTKTRKVFYVNRISVN